MATSNTSKIVREFTVKKSGNVKLTISFGDAALGASKVWFDGKRVDDPAQQGQINGINLGAVAKVKGKVLNITTIATDFNPINKKTSIKYKLTNGTSNKPMKDAKEAAVDGGRVAYVAVISFV